jgi:hypothetical protein
LYIFVDMHTKHLIDKVWTDDSRIYARTKDGGIHWPKLDEDLSFEGMFREDNVFYEDYD